MCSVIENAENPKLNKYRHIPFVFYLFLLMEILNSNLQKINNQREFVKRKQIQSQPLCIARETIFPEFRFLLDSKRQQIYQFLFDDCY